MCVALFSETTQNFLKEIFWRIRTTIKEFLFCKLKGLCSIKSFTKLLSHKHEVLFLSLNKVIYLHYNYLINTCTVASKHNPINTNEINTLRGETAGGRNCCGIYFCSLGPQNQRNSRNLFLLFDRFGKN